MEGVQGEAEISHGLAHAVRRDLANMKILAYLTAAAINLKRLAAFIAALLWALAAILLNEGASAGRASQGSLPCAAA